MEGDFRFSHDVGYSVPMGIALAFPANDYRQATIYPVLLNLPLKGSYKVVQTVRTWVVGFTPPCNLTFTSSVPLQKTIIDKMNFNFKNAIILVMAIVKRFISNKSLFGSRYLIKVEVIYDDDFSVTLYSSREKARP